MLKFGGVGLSRGELDCRVKLSGDSSDQLGAQGLQMTYQTAWSTELTVNG